MPGENDDEIISTTGVRPPKRRKELEAAPPTTGSFWGDTREAVKVGRRGRWCPGALLTHCNYHTQLINVKDDFRDIAEMPCARRSLMAAIASGTGIGVIRAFSVSELRLAYAPCPVSNMRKARWRRAIGPWAPSSSSRPLHGARPILLALVTDRRMAGKYAVPDVRTKRRRWRRYNGSLWRSGVLRLERKQRKLEPRHPRSCLFRSYNADAAIRYNSLRRDLAPLRVPVVFTPCFY